MTDARNVYLLLFVLLVMPTIFYSIKKRGQTKNRRLRALLLPIMGALIVLWGVLGYTFYIHTINRQVLIVAERGAIAIYKAGAAGQELSKQMQSQGIAAALTVEGTQSGPWPSFEGADLLIPEKTLTIDNVKYYPVVLQKTNGERLLIALAIQEGTPRSTIVQARVYWPEQIGTMLNRITYFKVGTV